MSKNKGLGGLVTTETNLADACNYFPFRACVHNNGIDLWFIVPSKCDSTFSSYLLTKKGLNYTPVVSHVNKITGYSENGTMRISPDGKLIALVEPDKISIFDFDNSTGLVRNKFNISDLNAAYAYFMNCLEFSPDGTKLYVKSYGNLLLKKGMYQYDLNSGDSASLINTRVYLGGENFATDSDIQLAPDGKIYSSYYSIIRKHNNSTGDFYYKSLIDVINNPNNSGKSCNYDTAGLILTNGDYDSNPMSGGETLPFSMPDYYSGDLTIENNNVCEGDTLFLKAFFTDSTRYFWSGPNNWTDSVQSTFIPNVSLKDSGIYRVRINFKYSFRMAEVNVNVNKLPKPKILAFPEFCEGDSAVISISANFSRYKWSTGDTTKNIYVNKPGKYFVTVTNINGCIGGDSIDIIMNPKPQFIISGKTALCSGDSFLFSVLLKDSNMDNHTYLWGNGIKTPQLMVKEGGTYFVTVSNEFGCKDTASFTIIEIKDFKALIEGNTSICPGTQSILRAKPDGPGYNYLWSTGDTTHEITITQAGKYFVVVTLNNACNDISYIDVIDYPKSDFQITGDSLICPGRTSILLVQNNYPSYLWNTGETTSEISVSQPGMYSVTVMDTNGCKGIASIEVKLYDINLTGINDIDFGVIQAGEGQTGMFVLRNESNTPVEIKNISVNNLPLIFKILTNPVLPATINIGSTMNVTVTFNPDSVKFYNDSLIVELIQPCSNYNQSYLKGSGNAGIFVSIPDTTTSIGTDDFCMPLYIQKTSNLKVNGYLSFKAEIRYNYSALEPKNNPGKIVASDRVINFQSDSLLLDRDYFLLDTICGLVLLPETDKTPFIITGFEISDTLINVKKQNGNLSVNKFCQSPIRRIQSFTPLQLFIIPNPTNELSVIKYKLSEESKVKLTLVSCLGQEVAVLVNENQQKGEHSYELSVMSYQLSDGFYFLKLSANGDIITEKLIIMQ